MSNGHSKSQEGATKEKVYPKKEGKKNTIRDFIQIKQRYNRKGSSTNTFPL